MIADAREQVAETNRPIFTAQEPAATSFATTATVDTGRVNSAATHHTALLSRTHYVQRTGHDQRARLVQQLQGGYGNHHVSHVIARMRQGGENISQQVATSRAVPVEPAVQPATVVGGGGSMRGQEMLAPEDTPVVQQQRRAVAGSAEEVVQRLEAEGGTAPPSPEADGAFQEVVSQAQGVGTKEKEHQPAEKKSQEAQVAAEPPSNEVMSKAQDKQVDEMAKAPKPDFDKAAFIKALKKRIEEITPKSEKEADEFNGSNKLESVKNDMTGEVKEEQKDSQGPLEEKTKATPDTSGITPKPVTALPPNQPGETPSIHGAEKAAPKSKGQSEVEAPAQARSQQLDQQLAEADITEAQLAQSNEPQFQAALDSKTTAQAHSETAPKAYRQGEQTQLSQAESTAAATAQAQLHGMHGERRQALEQVTGKQVEGKGKDEQSRAKIAGDIDKIYQTTKTKVDDRLKNLTTEVVTAFDTGAAAAKQTFEKYVAQKMEAYKQERYGKSLLEFWKWGNRINDWLFGMPPEVEKFYKEGRDKYLADMDRIIDQVATIVGAGLTEAKKEVADGRTQVQDYVAKLPEDLRAIGEEAATKIQSRFDGLEQDIQNKQDELINTLAQKYKENLDVIDTRIKEMQEENKGLIQKAVDAIVDVIRTIIELTKLLLEVLARAARAIPTILRDPIGFIRNLVDALKQGFQNFVANIGQHLMQGLLSWLTGALSSTGIHMPESLDVKELFGLAVQLLGLTYQTIRAKAVQRLGAEKVGYLEQSVAMFKTLATQGIPGLWQVVKEKIGDVKAMVLDPIQNYIIANVIKGGIQWILSLMNPASAFVKACQAIVQIVQFFMDNAQRIAALITSIIDAVLAIANGAIAQAVQRVEQALATSIPLVIDFLSKLLGLGNIGQKVQDILQKMRQPVEKSVDWVIDQGVKAYEKVSNRLKKSKLGQKVGAVKKKVKQKLDAAKRAATWIGGKIKAGANWVKGKFGRTGQGNDATAVKQRKLDQAMAAAVKAMNQFSNKPVSELELRPILSEIRAKFGLKSLTPVPADEYWNVKGEINPDKTKESKAKRKRSTAEAASTQPAASSEKKPRLQRLQKIQLKEIPQYFEAPVYTAERPPAAGGKLSMAWLGPNSFVSRNSDANPKLPKAIEDARKAYPEKSFKAGHLLNAQFGGDGQNPNNLTILTAAANASHKNFDNPLGDKGAMHWLKKMYEQLSNWYFDIKNLKYGVKIEVGVLGTKWKLQQYPDNCIATKLITTAQIKGSFSVQPADLAADLSEDGAKEKNLKMKKRSDEIHGLHDEFIRSVEKAQKVKEVENA